MEEEKAKKAVVFEGAEELLVEWAYALNELAFSSKEGFNNFRVIENDAALHWFKQTVGKLPQVKKAYEAVVKYRDLADERKVIKKENFKLEEKGELILGTFLSQDCPYKKCCVNRKKERKKYLCFRATPFVVAVRLMAGKEYKAEILYEQTEPGRACIIRGVPTQMAFRVGLSYKISKGTVKIHELDAQKAGIGLVDNVTIRPERKEISGKKLTAMSYTQTKFPAGMIVMNIADAKSLGIEEKDTVFVTKAGEKEEVTLVETETYEAKPGEYEGEYDIPGLEVEEEKEEAGKLTKGKAEEEAYKEKELREKGEEMAKEEETPEEEEPAPAEEKPKEEPRPLAKGKVVGGKAIVEEDVEEAPAEEPLIEKLKKKKEEKKKKKPAPESAPKKKQSEEDFEAQIEAIRNT